MRECLGCHSWAEEEEVRGHHLGGGGTLISLSWAADWILYSIRDFSGMATQSSDKKMDNRSVPLESSIDINNTPRLTLMLQKARVSSPHIGNIEFRDVFGR